MEKVVVKDFMAVIPILVVVVVVMVDKHPPHQVLQINHHQIQEIHINQLRHTMAIEVGKGEHTKVQDLLAVEEVV